MSKGTVRVRKLRKGYTIDELDTVWNIWRATALYFSSKLHLRQYCKEHDFVINDIFGALQTGDNGKRLTSS